MPTPFEAVHVRLSEGDLDRLEDGETIVMTQTHGDLSVIVDAAVTPKIECPLECGEVVPEHRLGQHYLEEHPDYDGMKIPSPIDTFEEGSE